jgi:hypothetical protein
MRKLPIIKNDKSCIAMYEHHTSDGGSLLESRGKGFVTSSVSTLTSYSVTSAMPGGASYVTASAKYFRMRYPIANGISSIVSNNTVRLTTTSDETST